MCIKYYYNINIIKQRQPLVWYGTNQCLVVLLPNPDKILSHVRVGFWCQNDAKLVMGTNQKKKLLEKEVIIKHSILNFVKFCLIDR